MTPTSVSVVDDLEAGCGCAPAASVRQVTRRSALVGALSGAAMLGTSRAAAASAPEQAAGASTVSGEAAWAADGDAGLAPEAGLMAGVAAASTGVVGRSPNGFPVASTAASISVSTVTIPGSPVRVSVRSGDVATVLLHVARRFHQTVEPLVVPGVWGWAYRENVNSPGTWSNHASGTALDLNAPRHPNGAANTFTAAQVRAIRTILAECRGTVRWGGDYQRIKDEMHFEIDVGPTDPRLTGAAIAIKDPRGEDDHPMRNLMLAKTRSSPQIWVGDGMTRRLIQDPTELANLLYWITLRGGDASVRMVDDLRMLGKVI